MVGMTSDKSLLEHIDDLVAEEKQLRSSAHQHTDDDRARLQAVERQLDQCWDLLRQRRAREEFDENPDEAATRPEQQVENYLQ
jgi:hypothetical protein